MRNEVKSPALADWALRRLVPPGLANDVIGDLREEYARFKFLELGARRAGFWYWRQAVSVLLRYGRIRSGRDRIPTGLVGDVHDE